mmetsp:Transcript_250/g.646  ORF Transcript_250/g.646 Transcript_250/m.646 type:complete len:164 (+) Transcript_250:3483-3974(+)
MAWLSFRGFVHRDLKMQNILVGQGGKALVADFGLAIVATELEHAGGTITYLAPEVFTEGKQTEKSDVYAYALVLLATFSNKDVNFKDAIEGEEDKLKHADATDLFKICVVKGRRFKIPQEVPKKVEILVKQCWAQKPSERPIFSVIANKIVELCPDSGNVVVT